MPIRDRHDRQGSALVKMKMKRHFANMQTTDMQVRKMHKRKWV